MSLTNREASQPQVHSGAAAADRLRGLQVDPARLFTALDAGDLAARQADEYSPVTAAGMLRWLATVRQLRQGLASDGWECRDDRNSPRVVNPEGTLAILPVSGSADTGLEDGSPRTANPRGATSSRAVQMNGQLVFGFTQALLADMAAEKSDTVVTWFLLYYRSQDDALRAELSLPTRMSDKGIVEAWRERIILPARTFGATQRVPLDAGDGDDVDFDISAR